MDQDTSNTGKHIAPGANGPLILLKQLSSKVARDKAQELADLRRERAQQAKEKTARYNYLDTVVYKNPVDESYFQQWQQGCR